MRTGAAAGHRGYYHEAVCYDSDEDLLAVAVPFLLDGIAAGEPAIVSFDERHAALIHAALPADSGVSFLAGGSLYARPAVAIKSYRQLLASYVAGGADQIRIIGEVPLSALGITWDWWARYESAINHAYDEFPLWSMCAYDRRVTPAPVLDDVARTHPRHALPDGRHVASESYVDPIFYLREPHLVAADPIQRSAPVLELTNPSPAQARRAVQQFGAGRLPVIDVEDLVIAVSETVTNALRHGLPPVLVRYWVGTDRIVVTVSDRGDGPKDPFVGMLPATTDLPGGLGLWITYQSCNYVAVNRNEAGFTIRLTGGTPT